jgi:hypothetical protein
MHESNEEPETFDDSLLEIAASHLDGGPLR